MIKMDKKWAIAIGIIIVVALAFSKQAVVPTIQGKWDISQQVAANDYNKYLRVEPDFDYTEATVYQAATDIKARTSTPEEAVKETL